MILSVYRAIVQSPTLFAPGATENRLGLDCFEQYTD
jgi:hypothetical protein